MEKKSIGAFIAHLRKSHGMTQQELADRLGVSNKTVSKWERDESYPDIMLIPIIGEIFNVSADEILRGERINPSEQDEDGIKIKTNTEASMDTNTFSEKQLKIMISKAITKFKNITYISLALTLFGLICLLTISYAFFKPVLAFGIFMIFVVGSVLIMIIHMNNTNSLLRDSDLLLDKEELIAPLIAVRNKYTNACFITNAIAFILSLPFILIRDEVNANSVVTISSFTVLLPILFFPSWIIYKFGNMIKDISSRKVNLFFHSKLYKRMKLMNIIQVISFAISYLILLLVRGGKAGLASGKVSALVIFLPYAIVLVSILVNLLVNYSLFDKLIITLAGVRNFLMGYIGMNVIFVIIYRVLINSDKMRIVYLLNRDTKLDIMIVWLSVIITILCECCRIRYCKKIVVEQ